MPGWARTRVWARHRTSTNSASGTPPGWDEHAQSPLGSAVPFLRKEVSVLPRVRAFRIPAEPVPPEPTTDTRLRVLGLLGRLARGTSARGRILAVDTLLAARPRPLLNTQRSHSSLSHSSGTRARSRAGDPPRASISAASQSTYSSSSAWNRGRDLAEQ